MAQDLSLEQIAEARRQGQLAGRASKGSDWAYVRSASEYFSRWLASQHGDRAMLQAEYDSAYKAVAVRKPMID